MRCNDYPAAKIISMGATNLFNQNTTACVRTISIYLVVNTS